MSGCRAGIFGVNLISRTLAQSDCLIGPVFPSVDVAAVYRRSADAGMSRLENRADQMSETIGEAAE
jgi:hypothetical protein